ncbi:protein mono-ADP-ribosyltransferase PARP4 isoform X1 [Tachysurus ichikawai]
MLCLAHVPLWSLTAGLSKILYKENDRDIPEFPSDFQVAKYSILFKLSTGSVLELQSARSQAGQQYRVVSSIMHEREVQISESKRI